MPNLEDLGWSPRRAADLTALEDPTLVPARAVAQHRESLTVVAPYGTLTATLAGRLRHTARTALDLPVVGDWLGARIDPGGGAAVIHAVLPRTSALVRKESGRSFAGQAFAANLDTVFIVTSANDEFSARRIERYVTLVWESGAQPVVVVSKTDLVENVAPLLADAADAAPGADVVAISAVDGSGMDGLGRHLAPRRTVALIGSSGVGKSTLINQLLGEERLLVKEIREGDAKGRHTTTHRELVQLPGGALLVDTPGLREVGVVSDGSGLQRAFSDVGEFAADCRFVDCTHRHEPGCAVLVAVDRGTLEAGRLESYRKLMREAAFVERKTSETAVLEEKRRNRRFGKMVRKIVKHRKEQRENW